MRRRTLFLFCNDNPINFIDSNGKFVETVPTAAAATGTGTTAATGTGTTAAVGTGAPISLGVMAFGAGLLLLLIGMLAAGAYGAVQIGEAQQSPEFQAAVKYYAKASSAKSTETPESYKPDPPKSLKESTEREKLQATLSGEPKPTQARVASNNLAPQQDLKPKPLRPDIFTKPQDTEKSIPGRIYLTYTAVHKYTGLIYSGRTDMEADLSKPLYPQALAAMHRRYAEDINTITGFDAKDWSLPELDEYDVGLAYNRNMRYWDIAYHQMRGREQQLVDHNGSISGVTTGGAWSDTGKPYVTGNEHRPVAKYNIDGPGFHAAASKRWGEYYRYTGN